PPDNVAKSDTASDSETIKPADDPVESQESLEEDSSRIIDRAPSEPEETTTDDEPGDPKKKPDTGSPETPETEASEAAEKSVEEKAEVNQENEADEGEEQAQTDAEEEPSSEPAEEEKSPEEAEVPEESFSSTGLFASEIREQPPLTIIIPTSTNRRSLLDDCLNTVFRFTAKDRTRIIVIDNGSVDDTADYLDHLIKDSYPITVLTNEQNLGYAAAVNQGLAKAGDGIVMVMHNDVLLKSPIPARLASLLEKNPELGLVAPKTNHSWNEPQCSEFSEEKIPAEPGDSEEELEETELLDGYCLAFRNHPGLTFSKQYGLAYFDDADFCLRIKQSGKKVAIAKNEYVTHLSGKTTGDLGLTMRSKSYWQNASLFHEEWKMEPTLPKEIKEWDPLQQFLHLGSVINPFYPESRLLAYFEELYTSEEKTKLLKTTFDEHQLWSLIRLMMAANDREVLRKLEEQNLAFDPNTTLYHDLIAFYFDRTIFSRCKLYIERLEESGLPLDIALYQLKVAIGEKDYHRGAVLLKNLMGKIPTHPEVLLAAAEIHRRNGNQDQSEKFVHLATKLNPHLRK
ncbi:glycosyltransferase, partial [Balneolaceae bacterium ANBcel3]|nr:glycosyltransferase [Balneolaceae bacterium ANBcel3]